MTEDIETLTALPHPLQPKTNICPYCLPWVPNPPHLHASPFLTWGITTIKSISSPDIVITDDDDDTGLPFPPHFASSTSHTTTIRPPLPFSIVEKLMLVSISPCKAINVCCLPLEIFNKELSLALHVGTPGSKDYDSHWSTYFSLDQGNMQLWLVLGCWVLESGGSSLVVCELTVNNNENIDDTLSSSHIDTEVRQFEHH